MSCNYGANKMNCFMWEMKTLLFLPVIRYVISTLELMVAEDYMIVYLNGATPRRKMPGLGWMKKCYQMIDRRYVGTIIKSLFGLPQPLPFLIPFIDQNCDHILGTWHYAELRNDRNVNKRATCCPKSERKGSSPRFCWMLSSQTWPPSLF